MKMRSNDGSEILALDGWAALYETSSGLTHWKVNRSTKSIAEYIIHRTGNQHATATMVLSTNPRSRGV